MFEGKFEVAYHTNADYLKSHEKLSHSLFIERVYESRRGHLCFKFKNSELRGELAEATGTLLIYYRNKKEKEIYFPLLKEVLTTKNGSPLKIRPLHITPYKIPWPLPSELKFSACKTVIRYVRVHEPFIITLLSCLIISIAGFLILRDLTLKAVQSLNVAWNSTALEKHLAIQLLNITPYVVAILAVFFSFAILLEAKRLVKNKLKNTFLCLKFW